MFYRLTFTGFFACGLFFGFACFLGGFFFSFYAFLFGLFRRLTFFLCLFLGSLVGTFFGTTFGFGSFFACFLFGFACSLRFFLSLACGFGLGFGKAFLFRFLFGCQTCFLGFACLTFGLDACSSFCFLTFASQPFLACGFFGDYAVEFGIEGFCLPLPSRHYLVQFATLLPEAVDEPVGFLLFVYKGCFLGIQG